MNQEDQEKWMEINVQLLLRRAVNKGIDGHIVYAYLNGAAEGVGSNLDSELRRMMDEKLEDEFQDIYED